MIRVDRFGDPACPWDYSAEPARLRMLWHYGDQLDVTPRMVVLSERPEDYLERGFTPDKLAKALASIQGRFGMPIQAEGRARMFGTRSACRAVVAARREDRALGERLLRCLRLRAMRGELIDEPATIAGACADAGWSVEALEARQAEPETEAELEADWAAARDPSSAALRLDHKLAGWTRGDASGRRYTCPSWVLHAPDGSRTVTAPGFQPFESLEVALADLAPELTRRPPPESVGAIFDWVEGPVATAEVAGLLGVSPARAHELLTEAGATSTAVGPEWLWTAPA